MASGKWPPVKNATWRVTFPILDADGDLVTGATSPDSERSIDSGTFADCSNEATEIATSSGMYYLDLNASEMNGDTIAIIVKSGSGKTTPIVVYPVSGSFNEIYSDSTIIASDLVVIGSDLVQVYSDTTIIASDVVQVYSDTTTIASDLVIVASDLLQVYSDSTIIASDLVQVYSDTTVIASDVAHIDSDVTSFATPLAASTAGIITGSAQTGTLSTTVMTTDLTGFANDELIGRAIIWTGGDADGQASDITDYASTNGTVTFTAITTAPADADTFVIV